MSIMAGVIRILWARILPRRIASDRAMMTSSTVMLLDVCWRLKRNKQRQNNTCEGAYIPTYHGVKIRGFMLNGTLFAVLYF
jgi:hypothetical protein